MHDEETVQAALSLHGSGLGNCEISRQLGIPRTTIRDWCRGNIPRRHGGESHRYDQLSTAYAYLLGMYLGDGSIAAHPRGVYRLRITLDAKYPNIVRECEASMQAVLPRNRIGLQPRPCNCYELYAYSKTLPCLFPQHGPGKKHERDIVLAPWQQEIVDLSPTLFLRGLIHSDGCRFVNTGRNGWRCPRYSFSNLSDDIKQIFCDTCNLLGLHWTIAPPKTVYVSRKDDVARLDEFVGPKS